MNDDGISNDQTDEDIFTCEVSDEALEATAGADRVTVTVYYSCAMATCPGYAP
jgi:hypothetical protein